MRESFTPGPWFVVEDDREGYEWNRHICWDQNGEHRIAFMASDAGTEPNAHLIAAAPDLYEALKLIEFGDYDEISDLHSCGLCGGSERGGHTANCKIRAALLKAHPSNARGGE